MFSSKIGLIALFIVYVNGGHDAPPPKVHTYNVPSVAKVTYPGPTVTKSVETYSAPSIEKTTTITRTITAPLNAPAGKQVAYSAPSPVVKAAHPAVYAAPAAVAPAPIAYAAAPQTFAFAPNAAIAAAPAPIAYAQAPIAYAQPAIGTVSAPGLALNSAPLNGGAFSNQYASLYSAPSLGYSLGATQYLAAAAPVAAGPAIASNPAPVIAKGYSK